MSYFSFLFFFMYLSSFILVLGGESWFLLWVGLEVNMISFISLIYGSGIKNVEVCLKYLFIQGVGSSLLLMLMILKGIFFKESVLLVLSYKMGAGPFFFWFPSFCGGISWNSCLLVMTMQKLIPLIFLSMFVCSILWMIIMSSMIIGLMGCFNETKLKEFLAFSSVHYAGWMMLCVSVNSFLWILYFLGYSFMLLGVFMSVKFVEVEKVKDFLIFEKPLLFFFSMMNMGGLPPMLGFFLKWWVFMFLLNQQIWLVWLIIFLSVSMFYVYMRLVYHIMVDYNYLNLYSYSFFGMMEFKLKEWLYMSAVIILPI
uniref:NADH-ubiquinone oxidoreductase chain 2 n=1 Tax=Tetragnatha maxillosa TaxID=216284 RepID=A0A0A0YSU7_9ARAC|nr:NADH dehydrogenase subunit 2 [Tetragnatha maxillosa]AIX11777.1 NADH dehydrogenase subunit 2 [Tetragnatha maxillosa]